MNRPHTHRPAQGQTARHHVPRSSPQALPIGLRPLRWQRAAVHTTTAALALTGLAWLAAHHLLRSTGGFGEELPSPLEPWALRLHGVLAQVFLLVLGSMSTVHIVLGWRLKRSRGTGSGLLLASLMLLATGLALYYAPEHWHAGTSLLHWGVGLALLPLVWLHVVRARRARRAPARVSGD